MPMTIAINRADQGELQRRRHALEDQLQGRLAVDEGAAEVALGDALEEQQVLLPDRLVEAELADDAGALGLVGLGAHQDLDRVADDVDAEEDDHRHDRNHQAGLHQASDEECGHGPLGSRVVGARPLASTFASDRPVEARGLTPAASPSRLLRRDSGNQGILVRARDDLQTLAGRPDVELVVARDDAEVADRRPPWPWPADRRASRRPRSPAPGRRACRPPGWSSARGWPPRCPCPCLRCRGASAAARRPRPCRSPSPPG